MGEQARAGTERRALAERLVHEGIGALDRGRPEEAAALFRAAAGVDPDYLDAYNHLGLLAYDRGEYGQAAEAFAQALARAGEALAQAPPGRAWAVVALRPALRALYGYGLACWRLGRLAEALAAFERLLRLDAEDHQGVRYLIGGLYHALGRLAEARAWYERTQDDPHARYNLGLLLFAQGDHRAAATILLGAFLANPYIPALLLARPLPPTDWWPAASTQGLTDAEESQRLYADLWARPPGALAFLARLWEHPAVQALLADFLAGRRQVLATRDPEERYRLLAAEERRFRPEILARLAAQVVGGERTSGPADGRP